MTAVDRLTSRPFGRMRRGGRSTAIYVFGALFDTFCIINVPGAAILVGGAEPTSDITTFGVLLALAVFGCWATVFVRERMPLAPIIAGGVLALIGVSYVLALVGVYHALLRWPHRTARIAALTSAGVLLFVLREVLTDWGGALAWALDSEAPAVGPAWNIAAFVVAALALALVAGLVAIRRARVEASASRTRAELEHERADALDAELARQAEHERIARDLHDGLGHRLSSVALAAGAFEAQAGGAVDPRLTEWAQLVRRQAHAALEDVRDVVGGLRSDSGHEAAPRASLRMLALLLAEMRSARHRIEPYVVIEGVERATPALDSAAYRIVQESLTNAIKHAPGAAVSLLVDAAPDRGIRIRVENPLVATSSGVPGGGRGVTGIRERAASVGGTAWIGPYEGLFLVDASLPWSEPA